MNIYINEKKLDFELENEQNSHDILNQITDWLKESNLTYRSIKINGELLKKDISKISISKIEKMELETIIDIERVLENLRSDIQKPDPDAEKLTKYLNLLNEYCLVHEKDLAEALDETKLFKAKNSCEYDMDLRDIFIKEIQFLKNILVHKNTDEDNPESVLDRLITTYDDIKPLALQIIEKSRSGLQGETSTAFLKLVEYFQSLAGVFNSMQSDGNTILQNLDINGETFKDFQSGLNSCFEEIITAFENSDSILFTDIMEYEVSEKLDNLIISLKKIRGGR